jgi:hypothetical protein
MLQIGLSYGSGTYMMTTSAYSDATQPLWKMLDHVSQTYCQSTQFGAHYSAATGDFTLNGDARFTLDGSYYGKLLCPQNAYEMYIQTCDVLFGRKTFC